MFAYYLMLGWRSLRRNPVLTTLMVLTLAVGVAACVSTLAIMHMMSGDPVPGKSARLLVPVLDNGSLQGYTPGEENDDVQMTYRDAVKLLASRQGERRSAMFATSVAIEPRRSDLPVMNASGLAATRDFFAMFDTPMLYGQPWSDADEAKGADVVVLSRKLANAVFGDVNPVGRRLVMMENEFLVVGVSDDWQPQPHYYHLIGNSNFGDGDAFFIPLQTAVRHQASHDGNMTCPPDRGPGFQGLLDSECTWVQFWFETSGLAGRAAIADYLDNYTTEQGRLGRFPRHAKNRLYDVMEWLEYLKVVGTDQLLAVWLAFGFLALCLVNTMGLMLAKFSARATEVGIRRALGASRRDIFQQFLIETAVVGLGGGMLGVILAVLTLQWIAHRSDEMAIVAHMDWLMLLAAFALSLLAALVAGVLPTWRACQVTPALQLKSQ